MKIAMLSIYPSHGSKHGKNMGGVASYAKDLVQSLPLSPSDEVFVLCNKIDGKEEAYMEDRAKIIRCFDKKPGFVFQVLSEVRKIRPDAVHVQQELALYGNILTAYLLQWLMFFMPGKKIITLHGVISLKEINREFVTMNNSKLPPFLVKFAFWMIYKPLCMIASKIIVHEEMFKRILVREYGVRESKIFVRNIGVEDFKTVPRKEARKKLGLPEDADAILFMGYLAGYKGVELLLDGFALYAKKNPKAFLVIGAGKHPKLGSDPEYMRMYNYCVNRAMELFPTRHKWAGFVHEEDLQDYFSATDVSVYPYRVAMSSSGPMAIAIGYAQPFLVSEVFATFFKKKDIVFARNAESLSDSLDKFFSNPKAYKEYAQGLKSERSWEKISALTHELYK
jgi:glycosyltransferase involved in cell wall biosynthesis